jgi:hypothetical protein
MTARSIIAMSLERSLSPDIFCCLVFAQPHEPAVPQVCITRPFDILKLSPYGPETRISQIRRPHDSNSSAFLRDVHDEKLNL